MNDIISNLTIIQLTLFSLIGWCYMPSQVLLVQQFIAVFCKLNVSCHVLQCVNDIKGTGKIKNNMHAEKMVKVVSNI